MALSVITFGVDIATAVMTFGSLKEKAAPAISVQLGIGRGRSSTGADICGDCGGDTPFVAVWDEYGVGVGSVKPKKGDKMKEGETHDISVPQWSANDQAGEQPSYVMINTDRDDGFCLSYVVASGNGAQWTWLGDLGYKCGAPWYNSNQVEGDGTYTPKCMWLDKNHSDGLKYSGLSLHMKDFAGDEKGKADEYQSDPDTLCKSSRRMAFFTSMPDDGKPGMFLPALNYTSDGADVDWNYVKDKPKSRVRRGEEMERAMLQPRDSNPQPGHLVVSSLEYHSGAELCNSATSYGPDFVSTAEKTYCDMSAKKAWPLCDQNSVTQNCFDLAKKVLRGPADGKVQRDQVPPPAKNYVTTEKW